MFTRLVATRSAAARPACLVAPTVARVAAVRCYSDDAGAIRSAKGSFAKREAAQEEQYFRKKSAEELEHLVEEKAKQGDATKKPAEAPKKK